MSTSLQFIPGIYFGSRSDDFKTVITSVLKNGHVKDKYIQLLTDEQSMREYGAAFTSDLVDERHNYQVYEQLGDLSGNKAMVTYFYNRFPQLRCSEGVKVVARLRINYGSKNTFCEFGRKLGFWPFISAPNDLRQRKMKPLLEDAFEAFLGVTEHLIDSRVRMGVGYSIIYRLMESVLDGLNVSLKYEDLYDSKTQLKETFDSYEKELGSISYKESKVDSLTKSEVWRVDSTRSNRQIKLGEGMAALKADAQQKASLDALRSLAKSGYKKKIPEIYRRFEDGYAKPKTTLEDVVSMLNSNSGGTEINNLFPTKGKKNGNKYMSTVLAMYCRQRDIRGVKICFDMGADPNIIDSDLLKPVDLLLIGPYEPKRVGKIYALLKEHGADLTVDPSVETAYGYMYKF
jgi:dsRNA-specific ribonuclease